MSRGEQEASRKRSPGRMSRPQEVVLLSGGIDSACLLADRSATGGAPSALFVSYGQPAALAERSASQAVAASVQAAWAEVGVTGIEPDRGEIAGRNALLAHLALTWLGRCESAVIYLGIHAESSYRDCSPAFVEETQRSLDFQSGGAVRLSAPYVSWPRALVIERARELGLAFTDTFSCETACDPCGSCASCVDRQVALASA
jgi:7-cyano-7-deazaguanine synthase